MSEPIQSLIKSILLLAFGTTYPFPLVLSLLTIIGLWKIFQKCNVNPLWALVPFARFYFLARCAGREPEGRVASLSDFAATSISIYTLLTFRDNEFIDFLSAAPAAIRIVWVVYMIRVFSGLCENFEVTKKWIILWVFYDCIPALIWGFSQKYRPSVMQEDYRTLAQSAVSGAMVTGMDEGLTVNLNKRTATEFFQKKVLLRDIHMYIPPGHMVLLLGGSGAGKTTFLNAVNGYEQADATITLNGNDIYAGYKKCKYDIGFVPQQELMRGKDTVYRTLMDAAVLRLPSSLTGRDKKERVLEVMKIFGLLPVKNSLIDKLSGGQKKRVSIAIEFISNPSLFILDEPDSGLDGVMARELMSQLRKIADTGKIVMVITHTPDRVIDLFDDVIVLAKDSQRTGRLAYYGSIEEARTFFGKIKMEQIVMSVNRREEGGEGRADEFIARYGEVQHA